MLEEGDPRPVSRYPKAADVAVGFVQDLPDGVFEPCLALDPAGDGELAAVRRPVCRFDVFEEVPRRAPFEGGPSEGTRLKEEEDEARVAQESKLALG